MWKFQDFYITQILRETNLEDSKSAKTDVFAILRAVDFVHLVNCNLQPSESAKIHKNQNSEPLNVVK